jgi:two-component system, sensor histidine kinase and response regulator
MKKILVIEDEQFIRENIVEILEASDFVVFSAANGNEGITLALEQLPDLILCDVMMPELDGHGVLEFLRGNSATAATPFIFLTARANNNDLRVGMNLGADDYLTKPFRVPELLNAVTTRLAKSDNQRDQSLQRLNELRESISLSLPHEFLTPISGILGCSELIMSSYDMMDKAEVMELLGHLSASARRLSRLIQNFLLHARLISASMDESEEQARVRLGIGEHTESVCSVINDVVMTKAAENNRTESIHLIDDIDADVEMRQMYFGKIIEEITDNALRYSVKDTPIVITTSIDGAKKHFVCTIENTGRYMTPEHIATIGAYTQFDRKIYEQQGSGLGLSIVKKLLTFHRGTLHLTSDEGSGRTVVTVSVPMHSEQSEVAKGKNDA